MNPVGKIVMLDVPTGKILQSMGLPEYKTHTGVGLSLSPDGSTLAFRSASGIGVDLWDMRAGKMLYSLPDEKGSIYWQAWSPDSRHLAVARDNGDIAIWNLNAVEAQLSQLELHP
jgi:WD40 repeat protein